MLGKFAVHVEWSLWTNLQYLRQYCVTEHVAVRTVLLNWNWKIVIFRRYTTQ